MGVEKNVCETRLYKMHSMDLYRPPALRKHNHSVDVADTTTASFTKTGSVHAAVPAGGGSATITSTDKTTVSSTSISCNNSPTHINESNYFDNNKVTSTCLSDSDSRAAATPLALTTAGAMPTMPETNVECGSSGQQRHSSSVRRERRPDRAVYIPRARRSQTTPPKTLPAVVVEVTEIQQRQPKSALTASSTTQLAMPVCNNASSSNQQRLETTSETIAAVCTATSTKLDEVSGYRSANAGKKTKTSSVTSREHRERPKKSAASVASHVAKITNLSLEKTESRLGNGHESIAFLDSRRNEEALPNQQQHIITENLQRSLLITPQFTEFVQIPTEIIITNEMNSNLRKRSKAKSTNLVESTQMPILRIEDVASTENSTLSTVKCDTEAQEFQRASKEINRSNRRIIKQTFDSDVLEIPETIQYNTDNVNGSIQTIPNTTLQLRPPTPNCVAIDSTTEEEEEEDDWETMYDDSGECLDPKVMQELTASVGKVKIEVPKMDYSAYLTKQSILNDEEFPHVLEVSNFPVEFKNHDLLMVFSQYKESGFDIKWVDDTHALAVFSSSRIAAEVLTMGHPFVVLKPLADATIESRLKAKKCAASLQPYRQRPETCAALARRLVTGALGVRLKTAAAERENEKRVLREAKERKMLAAKQRDEVWDS